MISKSLERQLQIMRQRLRRFGTVVVFGKNGEREARKFARKRGRVVVVGLSDRQPYPKRVTIVEHPEGHGSAKAAA